MSVSLCNTATPSVQIIKDIDLYGTMTVPILSLAFSSSLEIMVTGDMEGRVRLWDTGMASTTLPKREPIRDIHFLENERRVLIVSENTSEILDLDTKLRKQFLDGKIKVVRSPSQDMFATWSTNDTIRFWDSTLSKEFRDYSQASDMFFPQDNNVVVLMSHDRGLILDGQSLSPESTIELPGQWVPDVEPVFTGQEMILVAKVGETEPEYIFVYRLADGKRMPDCQYPIVRNGHTYWEDKVMFISPDGELIIYKTRREGDGDCYVMVYFKTNISKEILLLEKNESSAPPAFSPMGNYVAIGTSSGNIFMWDTKSMSKVKSLVTGTFPVIQLHFCTSNRMAVGILSNEGPDYQLWEMDRPRLLKERQTSEEEIDLKRSLHHSATAFHFDIKQGLLPLPSYDQTNLCRFVTARDTDLLDVQVGWVWQGNDRILLLPANFHQIALRSESTSTTIRWIYYPITAVCGGRIVVGLQSGDIAAFEFEKSKMLFERKSGNASGA
ncbi:WD40-repeat-containing domain protein [Fusarium tricinctum]|uniref:WD40-repeat-containing domain protein n=1 Tax=Fusarium tricinctum TaxID=61284 RepID=A0A8K0WF83_9HYPO|nr:WD40-repeat-containing domain protein [Fusarium tricinctum]